MSLATIEGCIFSNNQHGGIDAQFSHLDIRKSTFYNLILLVSDGPGACILGQSSTISVRHTNFTECSTGAINIIGVSESLTIAHTNFTDNGVPSIFEGGAISANSLSIIINITNSNFIRNRASIGGAISTSGLLSLTNTNFISNYALDGGAVRAFRFGTLVCCSFLNNVASRNGGGLWFSPSLSTVVNTCDFVNNTSNGHGGGMYIEVIGDNFNISVSIVESRLSGNIAGSGSFGRGGGVYFSSTREHASITVIESSFRNNAATTVSLANQGATMSIGGAIYMSGSNSSVSIDSSDFSMNSASGSGGGVYVHGSLVVNSSNFTENSAILGEGGAVQSGGDGSNVTLINSIFDYNSAPSCGVLDVTDHFHVVEFRDSSLTHNTATGIVTGGGVCCISSASVSVISSNVSHNLANMNGGVFYINDGSIYIESSNFANNSAARYGGVAYTYVHKITYSIFESTFRQNAARNGGGVLYIGRRSSSVFIRESDFSNNSATERGGVISVIGSDLIINTTSFNRNTANRENIISACNSIVSIYNSTGQILMQESSDVCRYFDSGDNYNLTEPINGTGDFNQLMCSECDTFIILTSPENHCPGEFTGDPCVTLQQYANSPSSDTNISLLLEPGNHTLNRELTASNSYNYTILGRDSNIYCNALGHISLTSVQNILITGLSLIGCRYQNVLSRNGDSVVIRNVEFRQNRGNLIESVNTVMIAIRLCIRCK